MDFALKEQEMHYFLYDLRKDPDPQSALANVHLPNSEDAGPVLLHVDFTQYQDVMYGLQEMCFNEGDEWMITMLTRPENAPTNSGDLEPNEIYILIAHVRLLRNDPNKFMYKMRSMKRMILH